MTNHFLKIGLLLLLCGCSSMPVKSERGIKHMVLCWLQQPGDREQTAQVIKASKELESVPGIIDLTVGKPVPSDRKIVDDSFDVGLVMTFANSEEMQNYISHPQHMQRVRDVFQPLCRRILVYDIEY